MTCKLYIYQRLLKGADLKEFLMYSVDAKHVWDYIWFPIAITVLNKHLDNINFFADDENWMEEEAK